MNVTLTVQHNIFLTKEERYCLHQDMPVEVIGISIPVWTYGEETTSEPAKELFCRYYIYNSKEDIPIRTLDDGYEIHIPHKVPELSEQEINDEEWKKLSDEELEEYYNSKESVVTSQNLLDLVDGGSECIMYREHNTFEKDGTEYQIIHFVYITSIEKMTETMEHPSILRDNLEELEQDEE